MMRELPKPHYEKLKALLENVKLPSDEVPRIKRAIKNYNAWINDLQGVTGELDKIVETLVKMLNAYKFYIDYKLIFLSPMDFLYRQKGQLKLDNTIIEEFLPHLITKTFDKLGDNIELGPRKCFSAIYLLSSLQKETKGGGLAIREKDQDFAVAKKLYLRTSHQSDFKEYESKNTYLGYVTAECKTNLDKTMFQEASATAHDVKLAIPGAKYLLLCEWLDMIPVSTTPTDIDEVLILRKAKRISSNVRSSFNSAEGRKKASKSYKEFLMSNPFSVDVFKRFIGHIDSLITNKDLEEENVLGDGYF